MYHKYVSNRLTAAEQSVNCHGVDKGMIPFTSTDKIVRV